jgi:hypothetical protein
LIPSEPPGNDPRAAAGLEAPMRPKSLYLALCVAGTVLPCSQLFPFLREHGLAVGTLLEQLFSNRIGAFFGLDVFVSTVVLWVLVMVEGRRAGVKHLWAPVVASLTVGVSLGLPLFLYLREECLERPDRGAVRDVRSP